MSATPPTGGPSEDPPVDTGRPIAVLDSLEQEPPPGFQGRLWRRVGRRTVTGQIVGFSWDLPRVVLMQLVEIIFALLGFGRRDKGGSP